MLFQGEKFIDTKKRLEKRTGLKGKSFEKIKFAIVRRPYSNKVHYLQDGKSLCVESLTDHSSRLEI